MSHVYSFQKKVAYSVEHEYFFCVQSYNILKEWKTNNFEINKLPTNHENKIFCTIT